MIAIPLFQQFQQQLTIVENYLLLLMMLYNILLAPTPSLGNMMTETEIFLLKLKK
jgi:hypothetical protein